MQAPSKQEQQAPLDLTCPLLGVASWVSTTWGCLPAWPPTPPTCWRAGYWAVVQGPWLGQRWLDR